MTENYPPLTNGAVAELLGISESGVSRLRSGGRKPSIPMMQKVEQAFDWSIQGQSAAYARGKWHEAFEAVLDATAEELAKQAGS